MEGAQNEQTNTSNSTNGKQDGIEKVPPDDSLIFHDKMKALFSGDEDVPSSVSALEGRVVRAKVTESWGGHTYHNAVVLSADPFTVKVGRSAVRLGYWCYLESCVENIDTFQTLTR